MLLFKDTREYGRIFSILATPILVCCIVWFFLLKKMYDGGDDAEYIKRPAPNQLYLLLYLGIMEYLSIQQVPGSCILRVQDKESRITHFMYSSQGSKAAYALAGITFEWCEKIMIHILMLIFIKSVIYGFPIPSLNDLAIILCYSLYDLTKSLLNFHTISYLFDKKATLVKFGGLLSSLIYMIEMGITVATFIAFSSRSLGVIGRGSFIRSGFNLVVTLIPNGSTFVNEKKATNLDIYGGTALNLGIMLIHFAFALLLVLFIDSRSGRIRKVAQKKNERIIEGPDMRNMGEIRNEEMYVSTKLPKISVQGIEKAYPNKFIAAQSINFGVENKQLFTLLGPNGAGKTSVLEVMAGIIPRTDGFILYENEPIEVYNNKHLSFCLQKNYLWEYLTFREHLEIVGRWRGLEESTLKQLIHELDISLQLDKNLDIKATKLSGGNKRKLNTVLALMAAPHIYILDEPTAGMDPVARRYFWNILKSWRESSNCSLILTTHTANEAEVSSNNCRSYPTA